MQSFSLKRPKPIIPYPLVALFGICLTFILLYSALSSVMHNKNMYAHITQQPLTEQNEAILQYIDSPLFADTTLTFLSEAEQAHMADVKWLFDIAFIVQLCAIGIIVGIASVFFAQKRTDHLDMLLDKSLWCCGWCLLSVCMLIGGAALINFDRLWLLLHALLFPQGNWAFSDTSVLITLYPTAFFTALVLRWTIYLLIAGLLAITLSYWMQRMRLHDAVFTDSTARHNVKKEQQYKK